MNNQEQSEIDKKKAQQNNTDTNSQSYKKNLSSFGVSTLIIILVLVAYFFISGFILYGCKVAQTNYMPTEEYCFPYEVFNDKTMSSYKPDNIIDCNIFETLFKDPNSSAKIRFDPGSNQGNSLINFLLNAKTTNKNAFVYSLISTIEKVVLFYFKFLNFTLGKLNEIPEIITVLFGPIIMIVLSCIMIGLNSIYYIFLSFYNLTWFLYKKTDKSENLEENRWTPLQGTEWLIGLFFIFLIVIFLGWVFFATAGPISIILLLWSLFCIFNFSCDVNTEPNKYESASTLYIIYQMFIEYKLLILTIFSLFIIIISFANVGIIAGVISIVFVLCIYKGWILGGLLDPVNNLLKTQLSSKTQTEKICFNKPLSKEEIESQGLLSGILNFFTVLFSKPTEYKEEMAEAQKNIFNANVTNPVNAANPINLINPITPTNPIIPTNPITPINAANANPSKINNKK